MTQNLWNFIIHSRNPDLIHLLETERIKPRDLLPKSSIFGPYYDSYRKIFEESIKCNHNELTEYFQNNFLNQKIESFNVLNNSEENKLFYCFKYYDFEYFPSEDDLEKNEFIFYYACQFNYLSIVKLFINKKIVDVNKVIQKLPSFFIMEQKSDAIKKRIKYNVGSSFTVYKNYETKNEIF